MATTRSTGYVVTAAVWNAVLAGLSDAGVFTGTITTSGTVTFGGQVVCSGNNVVRMVGVSSTAEALRIVGRSSDNAGYLSFRNNADDTSYVTLQGASTGLTFASGSTSRTFTFSGGRVNSCSVQPGFLARNTADDTSVSTGATVDFDTEDYDDSGAFASDAFTAPVAGRYLLTALVTLTNTSGGADSPYVDLIIRDSGATETQRFKSTVAHALANSGTSSVMVSAIVAMNASDTARILYRGAGATIVGEVSPGSSDYNTTYFSGRLMV